MKLKIKKIFIPLLSNFLIVLVLFVMSAFMFLSESQMMEVSGNDAVFYSGNKNNKAVSLMINVYDGNENIEKMLAVFDKHSIKATFFVGGIWATKNTETLQKIANFGHEIGNHGFFHKSHSKLNYAQNQTEILNNHKVVKELVGIQMNLFAPPSGDFNSTTVLAAKNLGYKTILWSKDTIDWRDHDENLILKRATTKLCGGDLILMHPTKETAEVLEKIITKITEQGFKIITVSENIYANIV